MPQTRNSFCESNHCMRWQFETNAIFNRIKLKLSRQPLDFFSSLISLLNHNSRSFLTWFYFWKMLSIGNLINCWIGRWLSRCLVLFYFQFFLGFFHFFHIISEVIKKIGNLFFSGSKTKIAKKKKFGSKKLFFAQYSK